MNEKRKVLREAWRWSNGALALFADSVAAEEPLEIRLGGRRFTLTMRTPGNDEELAAGFLFAEGFIDRAHELSEIRRVRGRGGKPEPNMIDVVLKVPADALRERLKRNFAISSSCGICGKTSIESITRRVAPVHGQARVTPRTLLSLASAMRAEQKIFAATGGLHAAALFDLSGAIVALREDVGRHNAVDKIVGWALAAGSVPLSSHILMVSGRLSFELVQKAAAAGVPILAAVSAPSSLAVELAEETGTTVIGFLRDATFNIYTHPERIIA
ncbi:MAG: formate dehydrogenase accessory sulfurtransferase FdhD [Candidatus Binataceae bacterium]